MCYLVKFGSSVLKGVCINRRESQKLACASAPPSCDRGVAIEIPEMCYPTEFGRSSLNGMNVIKKIRLSSSLKVIGTDTDRSTAYDFLLKFHSDNKPISCRLGGKRRFLWKIANFSHPRYI